MQVVDGREGGGQLVRTAVSLAALAGEPVKVVHAREGRRSGGLKPQHVAAVEAVSRVCGGETEGVEPGASTFTFRPGEVRGGDYAVDVGTAGSVTLVFDAVLPLATVLDEALSLTVTGGTDVKWAPPVDFTRHVKLPVLRDHGLDARVDVAARGFYPAGGGRATLHVEPSELAPLRCWHRGTPVRVDVYSVAAADLADADVADRQADAAARLLPDAVPVDTHASYAETDSPGSVVVLAAEFERTTAGFTALGSRDETAEAVAEAAVTDFDRFRQTNAAVDRRLADQLVPFLGLAGGRVRAPERTNHLVTCANLLDDFGYPVRVATSDDDCAVTR